jgi:hypothetical protein
MRRGLVASTPISGCPIRMFARGILVVARRGNLPRVKAPVAGSMVSFSQLLCFLDEAIDELGIPVGGFPNCSSLGFAG